MKDKRILKQGIKEFNMVIFGGDGDVIIRPNPTERFLTIEDVLSTSDVWVSDIIGRRTYSTSTSEKWNKNGVKTLVIDLNDLPAGTYFIHVDEAEHPFIKL